MRCPFCGHENIQGVELCADCGADLAGLDLPEAERGFAGRLMTDHLDDVSLTPSLTVGPDDSAAAAIAAMREARHGCVQVVEGERLVGVFTERDVLTRVVRPAADPEATLVREVMTPEPNTLRRIDPPAYAIHHMVARGFRHLPILDGERLAGSVSVRNLLRYIHREILGAGA